MYPPPGFGAPDGAAAHPLDLVNLVHAPQHKSCLRSGYFLLGCHMQYLTCPRNEPSFFPLTFRGRFKGRLCRSIESLLVSAKRRLLIAGQRRLT
jgi:hypothetical protein